MAAQQTFGNLISGVFIYMYKPFKVGEYVELNNGKSGVVEDINLRFTIIRNEQNRRMIIPNTLVRNVVIINSDLKCDILLAVRNSFDKAGIRMASPVRKILFEEKETAAAMVKQGGALIGVR